MTSFGPRMDRAVERRSLLVRVEAGEAIGAGHLMRCLALAQCWRAGGGTATFAMAAEHPASRSLLAAERFEVTSLGHPAGSRADWEHTIALARSLRASWLVVDGYDFGVEYQRRLVEAAAPVLWIDDFGRLADYCADLVLNQNPGAAEELYVRRSAATELLLGARYILLREQFLDHGSPERETAEVARTLLVTVGGADPDGLSRRIARALALPGAPELETRLVIGPFAPGREALLAEAGGGRSRIELLSPVSDMSSLMRWADLAVTAAGGTLWELMYSGTPVLAFSRSEAQRGILAGLGRAGILQDLGPASALDPASFSAALRAVARSRSRRRRMRRRGRRLVDGRGALRVVRSMVGRQARSRE